MNPLLIYVEEDDTNRALFLLISFLFRPDDVGGPVESYEDDRSTHFQALGLAYFYLQVYSRWPPDV